MGLVLNSIARKAAQRAAQKGGLDLLRGFALIRDPKVEIRLKALAFAIGVGCTAVLLALEIPLESILGVFLPFFGLTLDATVDGFEVIAAPMVIAALALPFLVPQGSIISSTVSAPPQ